MRWEICSTKSIRLVYSWKANKRKRKCYWTPFGPFALFHFVFFSPSKWGNKQRKWNCCEITWLTINMMQLLQIVTSSQIAFSWTLLILWLAYVLGGEATLGISGWGCAARTLEPIAYTRASFSWILLPYTRVNSPNHSYPRVAVFQKLRSLAQSKAKPKQSLIPQSLLS